MAPEDLQRIRPILESAKNQGTGSPDRKPHAWYDFS